MTDLRNQLQDTLGAAYTLEHELGGGGMSRVFVAEELSLGRKVVVKVLSPELGGGVNIDRFKREIQLAARLQHPHVVPLLSAGDIDGLPYFTMPLVEGQSLGARLKRGELPVGEAIAILRDVAKALEYAHSKGVIHRDIKPDNVLLTGGSATVSDFGVAKALSSSTQGDGTLTGLGVALGTPAYMAPEQAAADPNTDHRADIYAFGVMAYEMLAGRAPFAGRSAQQMLTAHVTETPVPIESVRPAIPGALAALVMRCLEKRPADRPQSAHEILAGLDGVGTPAGSPSVGKGKSRLRWIVASILVVAVTAVGLALSRAFKAHAAEPKRLAVAPLVNLTGDTAFATLGRIAAEMITQGIQQTETIDVVSSSVVTVAMEGARDGAGGDLARRVHATLIISGAVYRQGDSLRFQAQVTDAATSKLLTSVDGVMAPASNPMAGVIGLRDRLMSVVAMNDKNASSSIELRGPAPIYKAYQEFLQGSDQFNHSNYAAAIPFFERAISIDSSFGSAYGMLGTAHLNMGHYRIADTIFRLADARRDQFSKFERLMLDAGHAFVKRDQQAVIRMMKESAAKDGNPLSFYLWGLHAKEINHPREAVDAFTRVKDTLFFSTGWAPYFTNLAESEHMLGNLDEEMGVARRLERLYPNRVVARARVLAARGDSTRLMALLDSLRESSTDASASSDVVLSAARELRAHGHGGAATAPLRQLRISLERQPLARRDAAWRRSLGSTFYALGILDSARTMFASLVAEDSLNLSDQGRLGAIAAHLGNRAEAERIAALLAGVRRPYSFGEESYQGAIVAAALGDKEGAIQLLQSALGAGTYFTLRFHVEPEFQPLRGYAPFEAILRPKG